jgi:hypothetical protein
MYMAVAKTDRQPVDNRHVAATSASAAAVA